MIDKLYFIRSLNSPFKPFSIKVYFGKTRVGTPYFLPRRWVKYTKKDRELAAARAIQDKKLVSKTFSEWFDHYAGYTRAIPKKIGFDFVGLGWKTKWGEEDYRFEWSPVISFVFLGHQLAFTIVAPYPDKYWEAWLYYERNTNKSNSKEERLIECIQKFPLTYSTIDSTGRNKINYYEKILKLKYLKFVNDPNNLV